MSGESQQSLALSSFVQQVFEDSMRSESELAEAVAAMQALIGVVGRSHASTIMGLQVELKEAAELLQAKHSSSISLRAGCELFNRYVTRTLEQDIRDFQQGKAHLLSRGKYFANMCSRSRNKISVYGDQFIHDNSTVLVHGRSRVVIGLLKYAALKGKQFSVIMTEGRPNNDTTIAAEQLLAVGVPVTIILDSAVAFKMADVDFVLCGAEGVVENGGIINVIGTYQIAIIAQALNKPVYIAAESYKFTRLFPLTQKDIPNMIQLQHSEIDDLVDLSEPELNRFSSQRSFRPSTPFRQMPPRQSSASPKRKTVTSNEGKESQSPSRVLSKVQLENPACDYTPPKYITLLFTDLGILTPSAVSDELIKLYY